MEQPNLSQQAVELLEARYLRRNRDGDIVETPEELFERTASTVSETELLYGKASDKRRRRDEFFRMMASLEFLPNSPTLMNAGTPMNQLGACFVPPLEDTMEDIFDAVKQMALVQRSGGGTGFSFSKLRPKGDFISSTGGKASGPLSFMNIFDCATANIKQGGRRRGANMGVLRADHPDILDFIHAKSREGAFENFNLSVLAGDAFMEAVRRGADYELRHPRDGRVTGTLNAREVFTAISRAAWETGDPGLLFAGAIDAANPTPQIGRITAVNPCGEVPLLDCESCNLGSIDLSRMLACGDRRIDWEKLKNIVGKAVRFLDNVIDVSRYPTGSIEKASHGNRKIGLGVMGFASMLLRMGVPYDSDEGVRTAGRVMEFISAEALRTSRRLADERGVYPNWQKSIHGQKGVKVRNAARTSVAPTGSISIIADTTSGIEPLFALAYRRTNILNGRTFSEVDPVFLRCAEQNGLDPDRVSERLWEKENLAAMEEVPEKMKRIFKTALEIPFEQHLRIQEAFQKHVDNSVSKTINMPENASPEDVAGAFMRAWELELKGVTVYRYGSKSTQVLETGTEENECGKCAL